MKIERPSNQTSTRIYLIITIFVYCVQIITAMDFAKIALAGRETAVIAGLLVYTIEILIVRSYLGNYKHLLGIPFRIGKIVPGVFVFLLVFGLTSLCVQQFDQHKVFSGFDDLLTYVLIFILNLVPGAMTEEWLFRFFPSVIVLQKSTLYSVIFYMGMSILFMLIHLPKYFLHGNVVGLYPVFVAGIAFFIIYQATQNLPFVILIHAFTNNTWFIYDSSSNWLYLYVAITVASLAWGLFNFKTGKLVKSPNGI
jgi:membrane protease YdiL (CAAX protease family)